MTRLDDKEKRIKYFKAYYLKHKERILAKNRKWAKDNPDKLQQYRAKRIEKIRKYQAKYRKEHKEQFHQYHKKHYYKDIELTRKKNRERLKVYYRLHPERIKAANKRYLDKKKRLQNGIDKGTGKRVARDN